MRHEEQLGWLRNRVGDPVYHVGCARRSRRATPDAPPDRRGYSFPRAVRDDGREPDALGHRAAARRRDRRGRSGGPDPRVGRGRRLQHARGDRSRARDGTGRGKRTVVGRPLLQQAEPRRHVPAFPVDRRKHRPSGHRVQRARENRMQHRCRHARQVGGHPEHRRREGSLGEHDPDVRDLPRVARRFQRALRR